MKIVNLGDPFTRRLTLRLTERQYKFLVRISEEIGTSPSDYIRFLVTSSALNYGTEEMFRFENDSFDNYKEDMEGTSNANVKTSINDSLQ